MIAGLESISSGTIHIGDRLVNNLPPAERDIAMVFQNYALYPHKTVAANMAFSLRMRRMDKAEIAQPSRPRGRDPRPHPLSRPLSPRALGRPAPAGGDGPRHRPRPAGLPVRRAVVEPRRQAPRADADRDPRTAPAAEDHDGLRHPRPDRGDDHGRPDRRDAGRKYRAGRLAARRSTTGPSTSSSRASSAPRR